MTDTDSQEALELYKLHAELIDRVIQRRDAANRLFVGVLTGFLVLFAYSLRFDTGSLTKDEIAVFVGVTGFFFAAIWGLVTTLYRQTINRKLTVLLPLEKELAYSFFTRERQIRGKRSHIRPFYFREDYLLPLAFCTFFAILVFAFR